MSIAKKSKDLEEKISVIEGCENDTQAPKARSRFLNLSLSSMINSMNAYVKDQEDDQKNQLRGDPKFPSHASILLQSRHLFLIE